MEIYNYKVINKDPKEFLAKVFHGASPIYEVNSSHLFQGIIKHETDIDNLQNYLRMTGAIGEESVII